MKDVPEGCQLRLSDEFVEALDKLNRPWVYVKPKKQKGRCQVWRADDPFYKRLWGGWSRYTRRGHDNGAFIQLSDIKENILAQTNVTWWMIEKNVVGFRKGTCGRELKARFPIKPDEWWAKLLGVYWSSGTAYYGHPERGHDEINLRIVVDDNVVPLIEMIAEKIGDKTHHVKYVPIYDGPHKQKSLGSRVRLVLTFAPATFHVLEKFGNFTVTKEKRGTSRGTASRNLSPVIPKWIRNDDKFLHSFIEGYLNGMRGHSMMHPLPDGRALVSQVLIRFFGDKEKHVTAFAETVRKWFNKHGVTGFFREMPKCHDKLNRLIRYEFIIHKNEHLDFLIDNFNIQRPDMRARLLLRRAAENNYALYHACLTLNSVQLVALGVITEKPRTMTELKQAMRMRPEIVESTIASIQHLLAYSEGKYSVDLRKFSKQEIRKSMAIATQLTKQLQGLHGELLFQCESCGAVTPNKKICEVCGETKLKPVNRPEHLRPISMRKTRQLTRAKKLQSFLG